MRRITLMTVAGVALATLLLPGARAGEKPIEIKWKFVPGKQYVYTYEQKTESSGEFGATKEKIESWVGAGGTMKVICGEGKTTLRIEVKVTGGRMNDEDIPAEMLENMPPLKTDLLMLPDGTIKEDKSAPEGTMQMMTAMLFPIPKKPLEPGETAEQEIAMPNPMLPNLKGGSTFKYMKATKAAGLDCTEYSVSYDMAQKGTKEAPSEATLAGGSEVIFAVEKGYFVSVKSTLNMDMLTTSPMMGGSMTLLMKTTMALQLKAVEDIPMALQLKAVEDTPEEQEQEKSEKPMSSRTDP